MWSIVASWVVSPMCSGIIAFFIFRSVQKLVLETDDPFANAKKYVPLYIFMVGLYHRDGNLGEGPTLCGAGL